MTQFVILGENIDFTLTCEFAWDLLSHHRLFTLQSCRLTFELGLQGNKQLDIRVPTSGMRDRFLATLTQVRRELSERSPSPPKVKSNRLVTQMTIKVRLETW